MLEAVAAASGVPAAAVRRAAMLARRRAEVAAARGHGGGEALAQVGLASAGRCGRCWPASAATPPRPSRPPAAATGRRRQARRHPDPGAPRRTRSGLHPQPRRDHRPGARGGRGGRRAARGDSCSTARRSRSTPGGRGRSRRPGPAPRLGRRRRCASGCRSRRTSSTCCTSTATTCIDVPAPGAARRPGRARTAPRRATALTADTGAAEQFFADAGRGRPRGRRRQGPDGPYDAGRRGSGWVKVKPTHTLDLVVLAVEWGSGRRRAGCPTSTSAPATPTTGGFVMLGKTFKGMTDEMLAWQTERFTELAVDGTRRLRRLGAARAGRRDRLRRPPAVEPLPRWRRPAVRPRAPLPRRQDAPTRPTPSRPCGRSAPTRDRHPLTRPGSR